MFAQFLFHRVQRLLSSRWTHDHGAHQGACEAAHTGRFGPFQLEVSHCYVLDHDAATVSLALPWPGGRKWLGYRVCLGADAVRRSGFFVYRPAALGPSAVIDAPF